MTPRLRAVFRIAALGCALAGLFHAAALVRPAIAEPSPPWRHALFVGVNAAMAALFLRRPPWFVWLFAALVAQQVASHGHALVTIWTAEARIDWASVIVLATLPPLLGLLIYERRQRRPTPDAVRPP